MPRNQPKRRAPTERGSSRSQATGERFDRAYYDRFYRNPQTRVHSLADIHTLGKFVFAFVDLIGIEVRRIVDLGCGLGFWREAAAVHAPKAKYTGVEVSEYLCEEFGWRRGSVVDFADRHGFDLVVCQGVMQYLDDRQAAAAIENLGRLCRGALYLEVLTRHDWEENCDKSRTDGDVHLRTGAWYRKRLHEAGFVSAGGGVFVREDGPAVLYELERPG